MGNYSNKDVTLQDTGQDGIPSRIGNEVRNDEQSYPTFHMVKIIIFLLFFFLLNLFFLFYLLFL